MYTRKRTGLNYIAKRTAANITIDYDDIADIEEIASVLIIGLVAHADWLIARRYSAYRLFLARFICRYRTRGRLEN